MWRLIKSKKLFLFCFVVVQVNAGAKAVDDSQVQYHHPTLDPVEIARKCSDDTRIKPPVPTIQEHCFLSTHTDWVQEHARLQEWINDESETYCFNKPPEKIQDILDKFLAFSHYRSEDLPSLSNVFYSLESLINRSFKNQDDDLKDLVSYAKSLVRALNKNWASISRNSLSLQARNQRCGEWYFHEAFIRDCDDGFKKEGHPAYDLKKLWCRLSDCRRLKESFSIEPYCYQHEYPNDFELLEKLVTKKQEAAKRLLTDVESFNKAMPESPEQSKFWDDMRQLYIKALSSNDNISLDYLYSTLELKNCIPFSRPTYSFPMTPLTIPDPSFFNENHGMFFCKEGEGLSMQIKQVRAPKESLEKQVQNLVECYNDDLELYKNQPVEIFKAIVRFGQNFMRLHPLKDHNKRTGIVLMNRELVRHGFAFSLSDNHSPYFLYSHNQAYRAVIKGQENFLKLIQEPLLEKIERSDRVIKTTLDNVEKNL